jgi:hypothetical protein
MTLILNLKIPVFLNLLVWHERPAWSMPHVFPDFGILFIDTWYGSLDGGSAHCKASAYTRQQRKTSMSWVGFQTIISVLEWQKTVHALDCAAIMISSILEWVKLHFMASPENCVWNTIEYPWFVILFVLDQYYFAGQ